MRAHLPNLVFLFSIVALLGCSSGQRIEERPPTGPDEATAVDGEQDATSAGAQPTPVAADAPVEASVEASEPEPAPASTPRAARPDPCKQTGVGSRACRCQRGDTEACLARLDSMFRAGGRDNAFIQAYGLCQQEKPAACHRAAYYMKKMGLRRRLNTTPSKLRARALSLYESRCKGGDADACFGHGKQLLQGRFLAKDEARGVQLLETACAKDHARACFFLSSLFEAGNTVAKDEARALTLLTKSCQAKVAHGCAHLGDKYLTRDPALAAQYHERACQHAEGVGCARLASRHAAASEHEKAASLWQQACDLKHLASCADSAAALESGRGVESDPAEARELYRAACNNEVGRGCFGLASMLARGVGGKRNWGEAVELFEQSCELEFAEGCQEHKRQLANPPSWRCATTDQCRSLCEEKIARSCTQLAELETAAEVTRFVQRVEAIGSSPMEDDVDCSAAADAYREGCEYGDDRACYRQGNLENDPADAAKAYGEACRLGKGEGCVLAEFVGHAAADEPETQEELMRALEKRCRKRRPAEACTMVAQLVFKDSPKRALKLLRKQCKRKDAQACRILGVHVGDFDAPAIGVCCGNPASPSGTAARDKRRREGRDLLIEACRLGDRLACVLVEGAGEPVQTEMRNRFRELAQTLSCGRGEAIWDQKTGL